jgi:hypothetical protein
MSAVRVTGLEPECLWRSWSRVVILFGILINVVSGCAALDRNAHAGALAQSAGLTREQVVARDFALAAFARVTRPDQPLDVYIETANTHRLSQRLKCSP